MAYILVMSDRVYGLGGVVYEQISDIVVHVTEDGAVGLKHRNGFVSDAVTKIKELVSIVPTVCEVPPPESFPQWWTAGDTIHESDVVYVLRTSPDELYAVRQDGSLKPMPGIDWSELCWKGAARLPLTKQQAEAMLVIQKKPEDLPKRQFLEEVIPGPAIACDSVGRSEALREGDLMLDGNKAFKVPPGVFGKTPDTVMLPGGMVTHFIRPKKDPERKPATIDPALLEVLAHMRDQVAALCKRVESLERNLAFRGPL